MIQVFALTLLLSSLAPPITIASIDDARFASQQNLRVAVIGLTGAKPAGDAVASALSDALANDSRIKLVDQTLIQSALKGIRYDGSINMSKEEARRLGAAIGCDFFIIGKAEVLTRSVRNGEAHEEAYGSVMIVDARTGALAAFESISENAATRDAALSALVKSVRSRAAELVGRMVQFLAAAQKPASKSTSAELVEDIPDETSSRAEGFKAPEFLNRVKPEYTEEAERADVTATVEAMVVFRANGEVGEIEIIKWAGFGLDQSSERAIRQLKFKPATRDGKPINVRALIRHNFRRKP